jgi:hypothetical protein
MEMLAAQLAADPAYGARLQTMDQQAAAYAAKKPPILRSGPR